MNAITYAGTKKYFVYFLVTWVLFNHTVKFFGGTPPPGSAGDPLSAFPKNFSEALGSFNILRLNIGRNIRAYDRYCPSAMNASCTTSMEAFTMVLGLT